MILHGNCFDVLKTLPENSVHCVVTSPPYWGLRDYGMPNQIGLERTPELYVENLKAVFAEVRRVLRHDGTLWLNLGDCYATGAGAVGDCPGGGAQGARWRGDVDRVRDDKRGYRADRLVNTNGGDIARPKTRALRDGTHAGKNTAMAALGPMTQPNRMPIDGLKPKDLVGVPWRVAFALQAAGWYLRSDIIWHKPNPMPESVTDRPTKSHEYLFLLTKSEGYYYDAHAIREGLAADSHPSGNKTRKQRSQHGGPRSDRRRQAHAVPWTPTTAGRNRRSVWTIPTAPFPGAHFATFPPRLVEPCILAGSSEHGCCSVCGAPFMRIVERGAAAVEQQRIAGADKDGQYAGTATKAYENTGAQDPSAVKARILAGMRERITVGWQANCRHTLRDIVPCTVLDPFAGAGTTGLVAERLGRAFVGIELNPDYIAIAEKRLAPAVSA